MDEPAAEESFFLHADFFEDAGRGDVFDVADGPDAMDFGLQESPRDEGGGGLGHVALVPIFLAEDIAEAGFALFRRNVDGADELVILAADDDGGVANPFFTIVDAGVDEVADGVDFLVRDEGDVFGGGGIGGVLGEDLFGVIKRNGAQEETFGFDLFRRFHDDEPSATENGPTSAAREACICR